MFSLVRRNRSEHVEVKIFIRQKDFTRDIFLHISWAAHFFQFDQTSLVARLREFLELYRCITPSTSPQSELNTAKRTLININLNDFTWHVCLNFSHRFVSSAQIEDYGKCLQFDVYNLMPTYLRSTKIPLNVFRLQWSFENKFHNSLFLSCNV